MTTRRPRRRGSSSSTTTTTRPTTAGPDDAGVTVQQTASQAPEDYDESDEQDESQKGVESRRREKFSRLVADDSSTGIMNQPSYEASLEFLCDKFQEYKRSSARFSKSAWFSSSNETSSTTSDDHVSSIDRRDFREVSFVNILPGRDDEGGPGGLIDADIPITTQFEKSTTRMPLATDERNSSSNSIVSPSSHVLADQVRFQKIRKRAERLAKQLDKLERLQRRRGGGGSSSGSGAGRNDDDGVKGGRKRNRKKNSIRQQLQQGPERERDVRENLQNLAQKAKGRRTDIKG